MESSLTIHTPITEILKREKEGTRELVHPTYFKDIVGVFLYLTSTKPNIVFGLRMINQFMKKKHINHTCKQQSEF